MAWMPCLPCCEAIEGCLLFSDDFDRTNNPDLGPDWQELSGDWSISGSRLREAGSAGAVTLWTGEALSPRMIATVKAVSPVVGNVYRLYVAWVDSNNHFRADFTIVDPGDIVNVSVSKVSGGVVTLSDSNADSITEGDTLYACIGSKVFSAWRGRCKAWIRLEDAPTGLKAGIGNGAAQEMLVDDYSLSKILEDDPDCPACICTCGGWPLTEKSGSPLHVTWEGSGTCIDEVGAMTLEPDCTVGEGGITWSGSGGSICVDSISVFCGPTIKLSFLDAYGYCILTQLLSPGSVVCKPLNLVYQWGTSDPMPGGCECCGNNHPGTITFTVTE